MELICGIDEAGRGPVIGSMFIAGVVIEEKDSEKFSKIGLKDSKKLSDSKRRELEKELKTVCKNFFVEEITAKKIDELRQIMSLNVIELRGFAKIIEELKPDKAILDLPEPDGERFSKKIKKLLPEEMQSIEIVAEHSADENYPVVSAASILAKNAREDHVEELKQKYGVDIGSGYPHDKPTVNFLKKYFEENRKMPEEARESWSTVKRIKGESSQTSFQDF